MKKVFLGILYILLVVMMFVYYLIPCVYERANQVQSLLAGVFNTGISLIGFIFLLPSFVFIILSLVGDKPMMTFLKDSFCFFASVFTAVSLILGLTTKEISTIYVFAIQGAVTLVLLSFSLTGVIKGLLYEKNKQEEEPQEDEEMVQ